MTYSLRDRLREQLPSKPKMIEKPHKSDCYKTIHRTNRANYALPDTLPAHLLSFMTGVEMEAKTLEDVLFLDTETTGLSRGVGTVAFLTGMGYFTKDSFVVEQVLMQDYDEELFALQHILERIQKATLLVTFNGHTFDMPLLENRFTLHRMREEYTLPAHLDLLRVARSTYKLRVARCSLTSLEENLLGIVRQDDMPGAQVPKQYFDFIKSKDFSLLSPILSHNVQDILSLAHLLRLFCAAYESPLALPHAQDVYSIGKVMQRHHHYGIAKACYKACDQSVVAKMARLTLAEVYKKETNYIEASKVYETMLQSGQGNTAVYIALAKLYEHHLHNVNRAYQLTAQALARLSIEDEKIIFQLQHRLMRLQKKIHSLPNPPPKDDSPPTDANH